MEVGTDGWKTKMYAVEPDTSKKIIKRKEDSVEIELEESAKNPIYWFRNKDDIIASIKQLVKFGSTRYQEFMNRADAIEKGHQESSTKLTDLNHDMLVEIMNQASPESWANLMLAANEPIPEDQRKPVFRPDGTSYIPKYRRNSRLWDEKVTREKCDEFLQNNGEWDRNFCMSKEPVHQICRHRTDRCNTVYNIDQQEVIPIPNQPGAYRIKDGVTSINTQAFRRSKAIKSIIIPNSVTEIGQYAFEYTWIKSVKISESITTIHQGTFSGSYYLESVIIPNSVTNIESSAFENCKKLKTIKLSENLKKIGASAFKRCKSLQSVIIPDSVEIIERSAFEECKTLKSVNIPDSVTTINIQTFEGCEALERIIIPNSVEYIGWNAFKNCTSLKSVTIPDSVVQINDHAFRGCIELDDATKERIKEIRYGYWQQFL